jgi:nucleoid DNA-binding protein
MTERMQKKDVVWRLARRMATGERTAEAWLNAFTEPLYEAVTGGRSVTLPGFGDIRTAVTCHRFGVRRRVAALQSPKSSGTLSRSTLKLATVFANAGDAVRMNQAAEHQRYVVASSTTP